MEAKQHSRTAARAEQIAHFITGITDPRILNHIAAKGDLLFAKTSLNAKYAAGPFLALKAMANRGALWFTTTNQIYLTATAIGHSDFLLLFHFISLL
jgi:hypothetical protein